VNSTPGPYRVRPPYGMLSFRATQRYASVVYVVVLCPFVCPSITSQFCQNCWTNRVCLSTEFPLTCPILNWVIRKFRCLQNSGLGKFRQNKSMVWSTKLADGLAWVCSIIVVKYWQLFSSKRCLSTTVLYYSATLLRVNSCRNPSIWQQGALHQPPANPSGSQKLHELAGVINCSTGVCSPLTPHQLARWLCLR